ncbi:alpha/beta hydrolase [Aerococcaceae bacterium zg-ZJ1578]|uniref:alpha/beta hydrolase n=1 Tax=Aerococcaceae bacterium zg-252 TaxID=2796928 RepID=UPI001A352B30|nr:alpha/beta hydrolase [Aerococcaceae bacterium zg-1578]MBR7928312.1 alpha/beta hydrolase [Aerococcaceae bacterium zg-ZUI334]
MNKNYYYLEMKTHHLLVPYLNKERRVRILLPKDYHNEEVSYPVVYFHDGQNVFHSRESFSGHSWKVVHTIKKNPDLPKMIIVAIDNDDENRMNEYAPWWFEGMGILQSRIGGKGVEYAEFVMNVVKPFIDANYRTKSDKAHTAMVGSSLGGNITQFCGIQYQDSIGGLGVFSSANFLNQQSFNRLIERKPLNPDQRVFIYVGTQEGDETDSTLMAGNIKQAYIDTSVLYYQQLIKAGIPLEHLQLRIVADAFHTEEAWANEMLNCFRLLSEKW